MLRRLLAAAALLACASLPATAGQILYATAAAADRVDGFCVTEGGGLAATPIRQQATVNNPRRLVIAGDVLYVAGNTRVEALKIDEAGRLRSLGRTPFVTGANPRDIVVDPARRMLYMPHRQQDRIAAYPLDSATGGFLTEDFTSCVRGPTFSAWENMVLVDDRLYVTSESGSGSVMVYRVGPDGRLPEDNAVAEGAEGERSPCHPFSIVQTDPVSERRCLPGAGPLLIDDDILYVASRFRRRILSFDLASDGLFVPAVPIGTGGCGRLEQQAPSSRTRRQVRYLDMVRLEGTDTIFASFFEGGRIHAFPLKERTEGDRAGEIIDLPKRARRKSKSSFVRTPARLATSVSTNGKPTLYVSGGQLDRVEAYRLVDRKGRLVMSTGPFSRTDEMRRSFPNDVVVTDVPGVCESGGG